MLNICRVAQPYHRQTHPPQQLQIHRIDLNHRRQLRRRHRRPRPLPRQRLNRSCKRKPLVNTTRMAIMRRFRLSNKRLASRRLKVKI